MLLLFPGVPGGPELLVVLLLLVALFGVPIVVALLGWRHLRGDAESLSDLEARVRELEEEVEMDAAVDDRTDESVNEHGTEDENENEPVDRD